MQEHIFITGGAGFIGSSLTKKFLEENHKVTIFDTFMRNALQYMPEIENHKNLNVIKGDIRDAAHLKNSVGDATIFFHLAAIAGVSKYFKIPAEVMEINVIGTYNALEAVKGNKNIKAFIDFSTSESYGSNCFKANEDGDIKMENLSEKRWTYATSKIASEKFGMSYFWQYGVPFVGIRPFNIYGPGQVGEGVISYFTNSLLDNKEIQITGDGSQARTLCFIDDFIHGINVILNNLEKTIGQSYNIGTTNEIVSVYSIANILAKIAGKELNYKFVAHEGEDVLVRSPSIEKLVSLGFQPKVSLKVGLKRTFDWYKENKVSLD